ncbi:MAG TPA: S9 family peptidase [Candidatus Sulfopaludibacter sp.]|jgi:dipeptidyl-peptidase-4|nr:S9 family peptidase [Candidatus Sulfopaludibacter sp.]
MRRFASLIALLCLPLLASEELNRQLKRLYVAKEFDSERFGPARWIEGGAAYTTLEGGSIIRYETATGQKQTMVDAAQIKHAVDDYIWSQDSKRLLIFTGSQKVWRENTRGDYYVLDRASGVLKKLGGSAPAASLMFAKFSPDGARVAYVRGNNIYVEDIASGSIRQLTSDGSATIINGTGDWVYEEELNLRDGFRWSPDGRSIAYWQSDSSGVQKYTLINYTDSLYPKLTEIPYPKAGTTNSAVRVGVVSATGGKTTWMAIPGDPRNNYIFRLEWTGAAELAIGQLNRLQNTATVYLADAHSGRAAKMLEDHDAAWVNVPEIGIVVTRQNFEWINDGKSLLWTSERDGWDRAYGFNRDGGAPRAISPPGWDVVSIGEVTGGWMYFIASPDNATQRYLYRTRIDEQGKAERLTPANEPGTHSYNISPDGRWAFHTHSRFDVPPATDLVQLPEHRVVRSLVDNAELRAKVHAMWSPAPEFFQVPGADGTTLDAWMIKPRNFDASKKYPTVVYVYGEPAGLTVTDGWSPTNLFHKMLADDGYLVVSFENRGTPATKGREWRKSVYGAVGVLSTRDQAEAVRQLAKARSYVDAARVAVWGWSGGGTNTLNLMFRAPDVYKVGVSVAPVPDQRLYDTIYQERYMGTPEGNAEGYKQGSAINFAEGLKGRLLIIHGTGDDNVHFQGSQRLINRLVELGKPFDFMEYPNRSHAISEGPGTSLHIYTLICRYLEEHL